MTEKEKPLTLRLSPCGCCHPQGDSRRANAKMGRFAKRFEDLGLLFITSVVLNWRSIFYLRRYAEIGRRSPGIVTEVCCG